MKMNLLTSASVFAPFFGARATPPRAAQTPATPKAKAAEGDPKDPAAEGEQDPKAKKAEGDPEDPAAEGEGDPKAEADPEAEGEDAEGEDGEDPVMQSKAAMAARRYERNRIAGILRHENAAAAPGVAMQLAFETNVSAKAAGIVLAGAPPAASGKPGLADRMAGLGTPRPGPGAPPQATGSAAIQNGWDGVYKQLSAR